jgi:hypothetical protein
LAFPLRRELHKYYKCPLFTKLETIGNPAI